MSQISHIGTQIEKSVGFEDPIRVLTSISVEVNANRRHSEISEQAGTEPKLEVHVPAVEKAFRKFLETV